MPFKTRHAFRGGSGRLLITSVRPWLLAVHDVVIRAFQEIQEGEPDYIRDNPRRLTLMAVVCAAGLLRVPPNAQAQAASGRGSRIGSLEAHQGRPKACLLLCSYQAQYL